LLLGYGIVRTLFSAQPSVGAGAMFGYFSHWLFPLLLGYLLARTDLARVPRLVELFSISFMVLIGVSLISYVSIIPDHFVIKGVGDFILVHGGLLKGLRSHISLASICLILIFMHVHLGRSKKLSRLYYGVIPVALIALVLTGSRGYYIAAVVSFTLYGVYNAITTGKLKQLLFGIFFVAALAVVAYTSVPTLRLRLNHTGSHDNNVRERLALYHVALSEIKDRPLTGFGPGQGIKQIRYFSELEPDMRSVSRHPHLHDFYLNFLADMGAMGFVLFAGIIYLLLQRMWSAGRSTDAFTAALGRGLFWALTGVLIGDCFDTLLLGPWTAMEIFWLSGLVMGSSISRFSFTHAYPDEIIPHGKKL
ncbi:MAG: O-antigen ligase family protein, partial [Endomicrobiales bacterium]